MPDAQLTSEIAVLLLFGGGIYWMGRHEHKRVSKHSVRKYIHGRFIPEWVAIGFVTPGIIGYIRDWPGASNEAPLILSGFGLLVGLALGWIHGGIRLVLYKRPPADHSISVATRIPDDGNPYRPPESG